MKPLYKILIVIAIVIVGALAIYFAWKRISVPGIPPGPEAGQLPIGDETDRAGEEVSRETAPGAEITAANFKKISEKPAFAVWRAGNSNEVFYLTPAGEVMSAKEGPDLEISKQTFAAPNFIIPSPKNEKVLLAFGDPISPSWGIFDNADKVWRPLLSEIELATWAGSSDKIFALLRNGSDLNLSELNIAVTPPGAKVIVKDFRLKDVELHAINDEEIFIHEKPSSLYGSRLWKINARTASFNQMFAPVSGLWLKWLGNTGLEFRSPHNFRIVDKNLNEIIPLVFSTLPSKCATGEVTSTIYCFAPQEIPESGFTFPEDYFTKKFMSVDDLYLIDLATEDFRTIFSSEFGAIPAFDAKNPVYANNAVYFINRYDNGLYELKLENGK